MQLFVFDLPPVPDPGPLDAQAIRQALLRLAPRERQWLERRFIHGHSEPGVAAYFGISTDSAHIHQLRAARAFETAIAFQRSGVQDPHGISVRPQLEAAEARALSEELSRLSEKDWRSGTSTTLALSALLKVAPELLDWDLQSQAMETDPGEQRRSLLRRLLIVGLIVVTLWLYS